MTNKQKIGAAVAALALVVGLTTLLKPASYTKLSTKTVESPQAPAAQVPAPNTTKTVTKFAPSADRTVWITGVIGLNTGNVANDILAKGNSTEPLFILIDSPGGEVFEGNLIIYAMEAASGPVYTVCMGLCASMAAMILEYGNQRYMVDRSIVMFHPASGGAQGEIDKMMSRLSFVQRYIGKTEAYVAKRAGISFSEYKAKSGVESWFDAEDAVTSHFADAVVSVIAPPLYAPAGFSNNTRSSSNSLPLPNKENGTVSIEPFTWTTNGSN